MRTPTPEEANEIRLIVHDGGRTWEAAAAKTAAAEDAATAAVLDRRLDEAAAQHRKQKPWQRAILEAYAIRSRRPQEKRRRVYPQRSPIDAHVQAAATRRYQTLPADHPDHPNNRTGPYMQAGDNDSVKGKNST
jgi:hypothetical protein